MPTAKNELLHGTLEPLILKTLSTGPRHGYGIARRLEQTTEEVLQIEEGSLYPALYRMEKQGFLSADWGTSELGRRAKFYTLSAAGRRRLEQQTEQWRRFSRAVSRVLLVEG